MRYEADTHAHTTASGHAYSSVREMMQAAGRKGLKVLALTEHAMAMPGTCHEFYFSNYKVVPREWDGVRLLAGAEANIMDYKGRLDMPEEYLKRMDLVIASLHTPCLKPGSREENTAALLGVMDNPYVDILGHPGTPFFEVDIEAVVREAARLNKLIEINSHSFEVRVGCEANCRKLPL